MIRIAASLPFTHADGTGFAAAEVRSVARHLEKLGFAGIWVPDQVGRGAPRPDPLLWLMVASEATQSIELGTAILQVPLRNPVELAQRLLTMHQLTGGRFRLGAGSGSTKRDFDTVGVDYGQRFALLKHYLDVIKRLCRGERVGDAYLNPWKSAVGGPPIMIGAWASGIWVPRAARQFDGWLASGGRTSLANLKHGILRYREAGGKRAIVATVGVDLTQPNAKLTDDMPFNLRCGPESAVERIALLSELGYDDVLLRTDDLSEPELTELAECVGLSARS
jgi:alkanesulfonate monooxygenase SsuD/methylene tetrahydromethanopterin reductase-like flavin-dependent oxidoreductase (luciferase family)